MERSCLTDGAKGAEGGGGGGKLDPSKSGISIKYSTLIVPRYQIFKV